MNVGGCLIPVGLVVYEIIQLATFNPPALFAVAVGCVVNSLVCYFIARPVTGIGIVMPGVISPIIAASVALLLAPDVAAPVAFAIGVIGPLVGADLMHLKDIEALRNWRLVSEVPAPSMASYCRSLLQPIWHKSTFTKQWRSYDQDPPPRIMSWRRCQVSRMSFSTAASVVGEASGYNCLSQSNNCCANSSRVAGATPAMIRR